MRAARLPPRRNPWRPRCCTRLLLSLTPALPPARPPLSAANYFGEVLFWCGIACVGYAADPSRPWYLAWSGAVEMLLFFRVSAWMTDQRMLETRGPKYAEVMHEVSGLVPMPPPGRWCSGWPMF